jgi:hypothetical protein
MLTAMSSAMIYGLLPVFLVRVLGASMASVGLIEGMAEAAGSFIKIFSGTLSDRIGRRKPLVVFGYTLSAVIKTLFPLAADGATVFAARTIDRMGKGFRDAPRDAFLADLTAPEIRGTGFGLRLALAIAGFVVGPVAAIGLMRISGDDFHLVFWIALVPAYLSIVVLLLAVREVPPADHADRRPPIRRSDLAALPPGFWWAIMVASLLSLARFSPAFLILKAHEIGVEATFVPMILVVMYLVFFADRVSIRQARRPRFPPGPALHGCRRARCRGPGSGRHAHRLVDRGRRRALGPATRHDAGAARGQHCRCCRRSAQGYRVRHLRCGHRHNYVCRERRRRHALDG